MGIGKITAIERQPTLTKGKYNLLINAQFENGQSILVSKIFNNKNEDIKLEITNLNDTILDLAINKLKPEVLSKLEKYLNNNKNISVELRELLTEILKN